MVALWKYVSSMSLLHLFASALGKTSPFAQQTSGPRSQLDNPGVTCYIQLSAFPIPSMDGIFTYIWLFFGVNVGKYTIHGWYGFGWSLKLAAVRVASYKASTSSYNQKKNKYGTQAHWHFRNQHKNDLRLRFSRPVESVNNLCPVSLYSCFCGKGLYNPENRTNRTQKEPVHRRPNQGKKFVTKTWTPWFVSWITFFLT